MKWPPNHWRLCSEHNYRVYYLTPVCHPLNKLLLAPLNNILENVLLTGLQMRRRDSERGEEEEQKEEGGGGGGAGRQHNYQDKEVRYCQGEKKK